MINLIVQALNTQLLTKDVIERIAGIAMPLTETMEGGATFTYPFSHDVSGTACDETQRYKDLLPNDVYKSVSYWEQQSDIQPVDNGFYDSKKKFRYMSVDLRFVCWLNLAELGITDINTTDRIIATVLETVWNNGDSYLIDETDYKIRLKVYHEGTPRKEQGIFSPYSVGMDQLMYPFDFFALDFQVEFWYGVDCFEVTAGTAIDCPEF